MGTNYYLAAEAPCPHCGHQSEQLHVGKSSAGWRFLFASYPELGINSAKDWFTRIARTEEKILDEYRGSVTLVAFMRMVEQKQSQPRPTVTDIKLGEKNFPGAEFTDPRRVSYQSHQRLYAGARP